MFSLPVGTEMFHFPTFPPNALCVQATVTGHDSSWVSPFGNPRITARLPTSRGLSQAPTSFIGSWCQGIHHVPLVACHCYKDARVHCVVLKVRAVPPPDPRLPAWSSAVRSGSSRRFVAQESSIALDPSGPNSVPDRSRSSCSRFHADSERELAVLTSARSRAEPNSRRSTSEHVLPRDDSLEKRRTGQPVETACQMLLRKEVIQPHLPVRLPCYDFVPIASPTFDGSLHKGWATGFGCCRLS